MSCAERERRRTARPNAYSGSTMIGIAASTNADSRGLRHHHHDAGADEQHKIAQRDRNRTADRGFDLRRVGGEPRDQFAGPGFVEERGRQRGDMREHVAAQIGDDALAERGDEVVAKRARQREHRADADHDQEIAVDQRETSRRETEIDHAANGDRHDQRRQRGNDQGRQGRNGPPRDSV